jgi:hypothetical protein
MLRTNSKNCVACTIEGAVHNFVSSQENSDPSDRKVMVHARTRHGDIIIQRAAS